MHRDALYLAGNFGYKSNNFIDIDLKTGRWVEQPFELPQPAAYAVTLMTVERGTVRLEVCSTSHSL